MAVLFSSKFKNLIPLIAVLAMNVAAARERHRAAAVCQLPVAFVVSRRHAFHADDASALNIVVGREQLRFRLMSTMNNLSREYNCDSTTIRLRYDDTTTHSTTTKVIEITTRLRYDYDVSRAPASIQRDSTRAKN